MDQLVQAVIAVMGPAAIWLSQSRSVQVQRWACIVGLASQPFWFWATWESGQWGVFVVSLVCAAAWVKGSWVLRLGEKRAGQLQDLIGLAQIFDLALQRLHLFTLRRRDAVALAAIDLVALDPFVEGLGHAADLGGDGFDGSPQRWVLTSVFESPRLP